MKKLLYIVSAALCLCLVFSACAGTQSAAKEDNVTMSIFPNEDVTYMAPGQSIVFAAIVESGESRNKILWKSTDETIATVDENGEVTAKAEGDAVIAAVIEGQENLHAEAKITVLPNATKIEVAESEITVLTGGNEVFLLPKCTVTPANAYYQGVHWASSDESIAVVGQDGSVFGIAPGKCILTGVSDDPVCETTVIVDVTVKTCIENISLRYDDVAIVGKTYHINTVFSPENTDTSLVKWSSSDEAVATVDQYGNVKFVEPGTVTITCSATDGGHAEGSINLEGVKGVYALHIDRRNPILLLGGSDELKTAALTCSIIPMDTPFTNVTWQSDNPAVAEVDKDGTVTAHALGKATITAVSKDPSSAGRIKDSTVITVGEAVQKITLSDIGSTLAKGQRYTLSARTTPEAPTFSKLKWSSSDDAVLKVDNYGRIQARGVGTAIIRCEATDGSGVYAERSFIVIQQVQKLSFGGKRLVVTEGKNAKPEIKVYPENANNQTLSFTSTNPNVASVNSMGTVLGMRSGECTIIARSTDGSGKEVRIPVIVEPAVPVKVTSLGRTGYNGYYNEFTATYVNLTSTKTVTAIDFTLAYNAGTDSGQASFTASSLHLTPGRTLELGSWKASGLNFVDSFTVYLDSVTYYDGTTEEFTDTVVGTFKY